MQNAECRMQNENSFVSDYTNGYMFDLMGSANPAVLNEAMSRATRS
jgi:hypothetical protein